MSAFAETLRNQITKDFGEKCPDFDYHCVVCQVHLAVDLLSDAYGDREEQS